MSDSAGSLGTKYDLLKSSLQVVSDIMRPNDAVAIVSYDHLVTTMAPMSQMGSESPPGPGRQATTTAIASPDLVPRGATAIGQGMIQGAAVLDAERTAAGTPYSHFAMVVLTDGNENVTPYVTHGPVTTAIAPYSSNVYAIGLGRSDNVSADTLGAIANYMLVTGDITTDEQRFRLTKYFVQVLAGVTRTAIIVDPQGELLLGAEHRIPFTVTDSDVSVDVIALSPLAFLLDMTLEAPNGARIDAATTSPNVSRFVGREDAYYRMLLPAVPASPTGTHAGQWHALLSVSKRALRDLVGELDVRQADLSDTFSRLQNLRSLPYSVVVQAVSNLVFDVEVHQTSSTTGAALQLFGRLAEYDVPISVTSTVIVDVTDPYQDTTQVRLAEIRPGTFAGTYSTTAQGIYRCRFQANGRTRRGQPIQREELRTAVVAPTRPPGGLAGGELEEILVRRREELCRLLECILADEGAGEMVVKLGLDPKQLARCLARFCQ
jgi:hypothetical protein